MWQLSSEPQMMTTRRKSGTLKKKSPKVELSSEVIAEKTAAFLNSGGKIDHIKRGETGFQQLAGRRHIVLGPKREA